MVAWAHLGATFNCRAEHHRLWPQPLPTHQKLQHSGRVKALISLHDTQLLASSLNLLSMLIKVAKPRCQRESTHAVRKRAWEEGVGQILSLYWEFCLTETSLFWTQSDLQPPHGNHIDYPLPHHSPSNFTSFRKKANNLGCCFLRYAPPQPTPNKWHSAIRWPLHGSGPTLHALKKD